jgi:peroxiredoxin
MIASLLIYGCVLTAAQTTDRPEWVLAPRLSRSQELVYSGSYAEESTGGNVEFERGYRVESRILVLDSQSSKGCDLAILTVLRTREVVGGKAHTTSRGVPHSVRLEMLKLNPQGRLAAGPGTSLAVPLEGPATLECGAFVELPKKRLGLDQSWEVVEDGRPLQIWKIAGSEVVDGVRCVKLQGLQQSEDWDQPRADRSAWRRRDTVWLDPAVGIAHRLERIIERRDPARKEPTHKSVLRFDLESNVQIPRQLFEDRRNEVHQARILTENLTPLLPNPAKHASEIDVLLGKITRHLEHEPPTPYREVVLQVKRRAEAAKRGETPPVETADTQTTVATPGKQAPDFLAPNFQSKDPARLRQWIGKPLVLVFYSPDSQAVRPLLRFAQHLADRHRGAAVVIGLAMSDDGDKIRRQADSLQLSLPLLNGLGLRQTYAVDSTPKFVVIDGAGILRAAYTGWGRETADEITEELDRWVK